MINKISSDIYLYEESAEDLSTQSSEDYIKKFNKLIIQSCVDTLTLNSIFSNKSRHQEKISSDWESIKNKIVDSRGIDYFTVPSPKKSKNMSESIPSYISSYNSIVTKYFNAKLENKHYNMVNDFIYLEQSRRELDRESLEIVWRVLNAQIEGISDLDPDILAEKILGNTCGFFEKLFVERIIESTREEGLKKKVAAYAYNSSKRLSQYKFDTDPSGQPVWATAYTYLRGGLISELFDYCKQTPICREASRYFTEYLNDGKLSSESLKDVLSTLNSGESIDIFKRAILIILSRHNQEIDDLQENSLEDYLWFKLKLINNCDEATAENYEYTHTNYSILLLPDLQKYIIECGPVHFNNSSSLYVTALLACLCYGEAVKHLYEIYEYSSESLHLGVILKECSLLPMFSNQDLIFDEIEYITHVNFNKMISDYIKTFSAMLPNESLVYISFISSSQSIVTECSNLVIAYDNYQIVLNSEVYSFSTRFRKAIGENNFKLAVETIAEYAVSQRSSEACVLFDLIDSHQNVLKTWVTEIKYEVNKLAEKWKDEYTKLWNTKEERGQCERINYPSKFYTKLYDKYRKNYIFEKYPDLENGIIVLNCFLTFYTALSLRQFRHSLNILAAIELFPIRPVQRFAELSSRIKSMIIEVKEEIPRLILNCLEVHLLVCSRLTSTEASDYKGDMKNLIEFYGEMQDILRGNLKVEGKFKQYSSSIREILSSLLIN
jgi:Nup93/Nic96